MYITSYRYQVVGTLRDEKAKCPDWVQEVVKVRRKESDSHLSLAASFFFHTASFPGLTSTSQRMEVEL